MSRPSLFVLAQQLAVLSLVAGCLDTTPDAGPRGRMRAPIDPVALGSPPPLLAVAATLVCGDGTLMTGEMCDDGGTVSNDGCDSICKVEAGYVCNGYPQSICTRACGDGVLADTEVCDDGNTASGDGCSPTCELEPGTTCAKPPPTSVLKIGALGSPKCYVPTAFGIDFGDPQTLELPATYSSSAPAGSYVFRYLSGAFDYDTDLTGDPADRYQIRIDFFDKLVSAYRMVTPDADLDGAPDNFATEEAAIAAGQQIPAVPFEVTSAANLQVGVPDDDCLDTSGTIYVQANAPSACQVTCGDGQITGSEHCDDHNLSNGDGCSSVCEVEPGYLCAGTGPSTCAITCGDSVVAPSEGCDDGNTASGDGCSSACAVELGFACADTPPTRFIPLAPVADCLLAPATPPSQNGVALAASYDVSPPVPVGSYVVRWVMGATDYKNSPTTAVGTRYGIWAAMVDKNVSYTLVGNDTLYPSYLGALQSGQSLPAATFTVTNLSTVQAAVLELWSGKCPDNALGLVTLRLDQPSLCVQTCIDDSPTGVDTGCSAANAHCVGSGTPAARCMPCIDTSPTGTDQGCTSADPTCIADGLGGSACFDCGTICDDDNECTIDGCGSRYCTGKACGPWSCSVTLLPAGTACSAGVCDAATTCVPCFDDSPAGVDTGCATGFAFCQGSGTDAAACQPCLNSNTGSGAEADLGCSVNAPFCLPEPPLLADLNTCAECNAAAACDDSNQCTIDACTAGSCDNAPVAAGSPCDTGVCSGATALCEPCVDTSSAGTDAGCDTAAPHCDSAVRPPTCAPCLDTSLDGTDQGCDADSPICDTAAMPATCEPCLDTSLDGTDQGCEADSPVCVGAGTAAARCEPCADTSADGADLGCAAAAAFCDASGTTVACQPCLPGAAAGPDVGCDITAPLCASTAAGINACVARYGVDGGGGCNAGGGAGTGMGWAAALALLALGGGRGRGRRRVGIATVVVAAAVGWPRSAAAQALDVADFPVERFRVALDRSGVLGAEWAEAPAVGSLNLALWLGYEDAPLVLVDRSTGQTVGNLVDYRVASNVTASYVVAPRVQVGLEVPLVLGQDVGALPSGFMAPSSNAGVALGDARLALKATLLRQRRHGVSLAVIPAITVPTGGREAYRGDRTVTFSPEVAVSRAAGAVRLALDVGYRARGASELADLAVDDEVFGIAGVAYRVAPEVEVAVAASLATAASALLGGGNRDHAETLVGLTADLPGPLVATVAGGLGLTRGFGTPDWRGVFALRFDGERTEPTDRDHDGVLDGRDGCPDQPEDRDGYQDEDGCPDPDNDGDRILDANDRCPGDRETANGYQDEDGCPDTLPDRDGDGVVDPEDGCPDEPEDRDGYRDTDGCADLDNDEDGILDAADGCPLQAGPAENRGCPDTDRDGDGVVDRLDRCVEQPGPVENRGCPDGNRDRDPLVDRLDTCPDEPGPVVYSGCKTRPRAVITATGIDIVETVYFKLDKDVIERRSYKLLDNVAQVLAAHPTIRVAVEGHTDDQGDDAYNKDLSQRRAASVRRYLVGKGVKEARLDAAGFGEERPIAINKTRQGRARNRRVVFQIAGYADDAPVTSTDGAGPGTDTLEAAPGGR